ncbi:hypothetical protein B1218_36110, partial [Pseudomonas ogarae]
MGGGGEEGGTRVGAEEIGWWDRKESVRRVGGGDPRGEEVKQAYDGGKGDGTGQGLYSVSR